MVQSGLSIKLTARFMKGLCCLLIHDRDTWGQYHVISYIQDKIQIGNDLGYSLGP